MDHAYSNQSRPVTQKKLELSQNTRFPSKSPQLDHGYIVNPERPANQFSPRRDTLKNPGFNLARIPAFANKNSAQATGLNIGKPDDALEAQANHVASRIMRNDAINTAGNAGNEELIAAKPVVSPKYFTTNPSKTWKNRLIAKNGIGHGLDPDSRKYFESRFNRDFSNVRFHSDQVADQLSKGIGARAFTYSNNIYFRSGEFHPHTKAGQHLIAHELTHVVQQSNAGVAPFIQREEFGDDVKFDSIAGEPARARLLAPYTDSAIAEELYGDPNIPIAYDEDLIIDVQYHQLLQKWRTFFDEPASGEIPNEPTNSWPFAGFSADQIQSYIDEKTVGVAVNLVSARVFIDVDGLDRRLEVPLNWFSTENLEIVPLIPPASSREAALSEQADLGFLREARGIAPVAFFRDANNLIWPTLVNPQTAPRIMSVYPQAFAAAQRDVEATRDAFVHLAFWYVGARFPMRTNSTGSGGANAGRQSASTPGNAAPATTEAAAAPALIRSAELLKPPGGVQALATLTRWTTGGRGLAGQEANLARTAEIIEQLPSHIDAIRAGGVTKEMATQWAQFYRQVAAQNPVTATAGNANAVARGRLMQAIADLL